MGSGSVRQHTRRTKDGKTATVRQHSRKTKGRRGLVSPGHAFKLAKKAFQAARRKKRATALVFGALAVGELGAWVGLRGVGVALATAGVLAIGVAYLAGIASGVDL
jgi:hypothetical protein